ncbi:MAG TPA: DUF3344 domain-containing protein [Methanomicrobiales archaeon]|nr:DUF3344 domain-containing protein [Methanomicrobiales archaeon]
MRFPFPGALRGRSPRTRFPSSGPLLLGLAFLAVGALVGTAAADNYVGGLPLTTIQTGTVSGGLYVDASMLSWGTRDVAKSFSLPPDATGENIQWARLYVMVYCGHMQNNYRGKATITWDGNGDGSYETTLGSEDLNVAYVYASNGGITPAAVNDHTNRVTSDYLMYYDVTSLVRSRNPKARVVTTAVDGSFDGRIKMITLVVAYNDGDADKVYYWVNQGHDTDTYYSDDILGQDYVGSTTFDLSGVPEEFDEARLTVNHIASADGLYAFNGDEIDTDPITGNYQGAYFGYNIWDVSGMVLPGEVNDLSYDRSGQGGSGEFSGQFYKIPLAVLTVTVRGPAPGSQNALPGSLTVTSVPPSASIYLDGAFTGFETNNTITGLSPGEHVIHLEKENYRVPGDDSIEILAGKNISYHMDLEPINGSLLVSSEPDGAWVFLDGINQSVQTPSLMEQVITGTYNLSLKRDGWEDYLEAVTVEEDKTAEIVAVLEPMVEEATSATGSITGYEGKPLEVFASGILRGDLTIQTVSSYTGLIPSGESREFLLPVQVPANATVDLARLYTFTTWGHNTTSRTGVTPRLRVNLGESRLRQDRIYVDRKGQGIYDYPVTTHAYNVTGLIPDNGTYRISIANNLPSGQTFALYGVALALVTRDAGRPYMQYFLAEGADVLFADPALGVDPGEAKTALGFSGIPEPGRIGNASLLLASTAASGTKTDRNRVTLGEEAWENPLSGGSSAISTAALGMTGRVPGPSMNGTIESVMGEGKGDYMENRLAALVIHYEGEDEPRGLAKDLGGSGTAAPAILPVEEVPLNLTPEGLSAQRITTLSGDLEILVRHGSRISRTEGEVGSLEIQKLPPPEEAGPSWAYRIGSPGMQADIPLVLIALLNRTLPDADGVPALFLYHPNPGGWVEVGSRWDAATGRLTADIISLGFYAAGIPGPAGWAWVPEGEKGSAPSDEAGGISGPGTSPELVELDPSRHTYTLSIHTNPPGALVYLDGVYLGKTTPLRLREVPGGAHNLTLALHLFSARAEDIFLTGDTTLAVNLTREGNTYIADMRRFEEIPLDWEKNPFGSVAVSSDPSGAVIYVDGKKTSMVTPKVISGLSQGLHTIRVNKPLVIYPVDQKKVLVNVNIIAPLRFDALESPANRTLSITSPGYTGRPFSVNGMYAGDTIPAQARVPLLNGFITVLEDGIFHSFPVPPCLGEGDTLTIPRDGKALAGVFIESAPPGAEISVDGFQTGISTPYLLSNLTEGWHLIGASKEGQLPAGELLYVEDQYSLTIDHQLFLTLPDYPWGSLTVESDPPGAKIYLFNRDTRVKTPFTFHYLEIGTLELKVMDRNLTKIREVTIQPGKTVYARVDLTPQ